MDYNPVYVPFFNLETVFLDKDTGLPLSNGVVSFYQDSDRNNYLDVYQITGTSPSYTYTALQNPMTLSISGTFVDINGNPVVPYAQVVDLTDGTLQTYYVTVYSSGGVFQEAIENTPYVPGGVTPVDQLQSTDNLISNPQFVLVNFNALSGYTYSLSGTGISTPVAPDWNMLTSGSGTLTVSQTQPTSDADVTNPPYALQINGSSGFGSTITLAQRFNHSPRLFSGQDISFSMTVAVNMATTISVNYTPSDGTPTVIISAAALVGDGNFYLVQGNVTIPATSSDPASTGYVEIDIILNTGITYQITSVQFLGASVPNVDIPFQEISYERQVDQLFHDYKYSLMILPKEDILTGWNFGLNPWQFTSTSSTTVASKCVYTADQTIIYQQNGASQVAVGQASYALNNGFQVKAVTNTNQFALIQYIDPTTIASYWQTTVSTLVRAQIETSHASVVNFKLRLIYRSTLPSQIGTTEPISSWSSGGDPVFSSGWTAITPPADPVYTLTTGFSTLSLFPEYVFNGMTLPAATSANMTLGIVVYTIANMSSTSTADTITFQSISLVPNSFAIDTTPMTFDQSLRRCEFYYEKSYPNGVLPGSGSDMTPYNQDMIWFYQDNYNQAGSGGNFYASAFTVYYKTVKRVVPVANSGWSPTNVNFWCPDGTASEVQYSIYTGDSLTGGTYTKGGDQIDFAITNWDPTQVGVNSITCLPNTASAVSVYQGGGTVGNATNSYIQFHYTINCQLGMGA